MDCDSFSFWFCFVSRNAYNIHMNIYSYEFGFNKRSKPQEKTREKSNENQCTFLEDEKGM